MHGASGSRSESPLPDAQMHVRPCFRVTPQLHRDWLTDRKHGLQQLSAPQTQTKGSEITSAHSQLIHKHAGGETPPTAPWEILLHSSAICSERERREGERERGRERSETGGRVSEEEEGGGREGGRNTVFVVDSLNTSCFVNVKEKQRAGSYIRDTPIPSMDR